MYQLHVCRGLADGCPNALWTDASLARAVADAIRASAWLRRTAAPNNGGAVLHHARLKVALAACPNACTMPQIRDVGLIATLVPQGVGPGCNGCGCCEQTCLERAITVRQDRAELCPQRCVGCGACIRACPGQVIESAKVQIRVLVGGRMGRHPRWAEELCVVDAAAVVDVLTTWLDHLAREAQPAERVAEVVGRIGAERLRQYVFTVRDGE